MQAEIIPKQESILRGGTPVLHNVLVCTVLMHDTDIYIYKCTNILGYILIPQSGHIPAINLPLDKSHISLPKVTHVF
jgi:hypothetical protein